MNKTDFIFNKLMDVWRIVFCIVICPLLGMVVGVATTGLAYDDALCPMEGINI